ncbi:MAG: right-handed parallel beta-helix repeat-containing protein [Microcella pacifica]|uniref:right-handed parallel beta-helix repeat-containing protein n=1 Tax=Microcella pacifica TaxID=2591847 RepID=UPI00331638A9
MTDLSDTGPTPGAALDTERAWPKRYVLIAGGTVALLAGITGAGIAAALTSEAPDSNVGAYSTPEASVSTSPLEPTPPTTPPVPSSELLVECQSATVEVNDADELQEALDVAEPGTSILLAPGTYTGEFVASRAGTAAAPISLCGGRDAVLDGDGIEGGIVLHLDGASHWVVAGFTVRNGQKGVMADGVTGVRIEGLAVTVIGDEAIHLRQHSSDNAVVGNEISDTGLRRKKFGEGVYIGTAQSNWCDITECEPDRSDRNLIEGNRMTRTTAEAIDIKEGTTGGIVRGNHFDGGEISGADSWVDVKGNQWLIEGNVGVDSPQDGFQTHEILSGWGTGNIFRGNSADVSGPGFGFSLTPVLGNVVECSNTASRAGEGVSNVRCTPR